MFKQEVALCYWLEHVSAIFLCSLVENSTSTVRFFIMQLNIFYSKDQYCKLLDNRRKRSTEVVTEQILWSKFVPIPYTKCCYNLPIYDDSYLKLDPPINTSVNSVIATDPHIDSSCKHSCHKDKKFDMIICQLAW